MFIGYQNNIARYIKNTREELEAIRNVTFDRIEEVPFAEMFNGVVYTSEEELNQAKAAAVRAIRNSYLEKYVDPKQLVMVWESLSAEDKKLYADYRQYLLDYTEAEDWYLQNPMTLDEWELTAKPVEEIEQVTVQLTEPESEELAEDIVDVILAK